MATVTKHVRLSREFLAKFDWKKKGLTSREPFIEWARTKYDPPLRVSEKQWKPLKEGQPVRREIVEAFTVYLTDELHLGRFLVSTVAEPVEVNPASLEKPARGRNFWRLPWTDLFAHIAKQFSVPEEGYCQDEADIWLAATMIFQHVEWKTGEPAECMMKRTFADYAQSLLMLWKANVNAVLFATEGNRRIGVSIVAPLTEEFYRRFRNGDAEDSDITPEDLLTQSRYLLLDAAAEAQEIDARQAKGSRSMAQIRTLLFQYASLCPPLHKGVVNPRMISFAVTEEARKNFEAYHYVSVGEATPLTGMPIVEFAPPKPGEDGYLTAFAQYVAMKATLLLYQANIAGRHLLIEG